MKGSEGGELSDPLSTDPASSKYDAQDYYAKNYAGQMGGMSMGDE